MVSGLSPLVISLDLRRDRRLRTCAQWLVEDSKVKNRFQSQVMQSQKSVQKEKHWADVNQAKRMQQNQVFLLQKGVFVSECLCQSGSLFVYVDSLSCGD